MINKSNDLPSFVNETNLPNIVDKLTDAKNIKISNNKYGNRVQTVVDKIVEKADDITKAIEQEVVNNSYSFKVGTGNIDVSADIEDGFGEVGIKGVTYQNLYPQLNTKNYYDKYGGIQFDRDIIKFTANGSYQNIFLKKEALIVKPNTTYTLIIDILKNTIVNEQDDSMLLFLETSKESNQLSYFNERIRLNKNDDIGRYEFVVTTKSDFSVSSYATRCFLNIKATSGELWIKYCILEGDHTNNNNLPSHFEGIVGVGDKSKNLFNYKLHDSIEYNGSYYMLVKERWRSNVVEYTVEPNTDYTISVDRYEGNLWLNFEVDGVQFNNNNYSKFSKVIRTNETGKLLLRVGANGSADVGHKFINLQLEKGTVATTYEPHHDGHKIEILSNGKNIFNTDLLKKDSAYMSNLFRNQFDFQGWAIISMSNEQVRKILKPNTTYTLSFKARMLQKMGTVQVYRYEVGMMFYHQDASPIHFGTCKTNSITQVNDEKEMQVTFTTPGNLDKYELRVYSNRYAQGETIQTDIVRFFDMQIEENISKTSFEYYQEDKTQILLDEPLMRLPDGTCDEITSDGKLIRRVGKYTFNGSEGFATATSSVDVSDGYFTCYASRLNSNIVSNGGFICDKFKYYKYDADFRTYKNEESCSDGGGYKRQYFRISSSKLTENTMAGFKKWLQENPTTVYYKFATPVITDIAPATLRIFKDGHLTFNTLVAPKSNHVVQLNKSAQIQNAIKESQSLDNRINVLENNYDNLILFTMSRLNDLELNYTLK